MSVHDIFGSEPSDAEREWLEREPEPPVQDPTPFAEPNSWTPIDLSALPEKPPTQPELGGFGFVYPGKRHIFSGPPESAKTLLAYALVIKVVRAEGRALIVDFEMGAYDARNRLRELGATQDELARIAFVEPWEPLDTHIAAGLVNMNFDIVLIDAGAGAYAIQGLDDEKRQQVEKFAQLYVNPFWRAGTATVVIDHVVKNVEARGSYAIGSERKLGGADVHLGFTVVHAIKRGTTGEYKITTHKDRSGFLKRGLLKKLHLRSDPDTHAIDLAFEEPQEGDDDVKPRYTGYMEKVSKWLEHQTEPATSSELRTGVGGKAEYVGAATDTLVDEGYVERYEGARRARYHKSLRPYREEDDEQVFNPFPESFPSRSPDREPLDDLSRSPFPPPRGTGRNESDGPGTTQPFPTDDIPF